MISVKMLAISNKMSENLGKSTEHVFGQVVGTSEKKLCTAWQSGVLTKDFDKTTLSIAAKHLKDKSELAKDEFIMGK